MVEVFTNDDQLFDRLLVFTNEAICVSNPEQGRLSAIASQLREGVPVGTVVPDVQEITYSAISSVKANRHRTDLNIYYKEQSRDRLKNVDFANAEARDRALASLARRLPRSFQRSDVQYGPARAVLAPLATAGAFAAFTYLAVQAAVEVGAGDEIIIRGSATTQKRLFVWALGLLGPTGIGLVGGVVVLGCLLWLIARIKKPPLMTILSAQQ